MTAPVDDIYLLEELAANAWPAEVVQFVDGWRFRYTLGVSSRRVNSVWPNNLGKYRRLPVRLVVMRHSRPSGTLQLCYTYIYGMD
jgi:hypothetical protein